MTMQLRRGETPEFVDQLRERASAGDVEVMLRIAVIARPQSRTVTESEHY
jgi:hypothetical protein